ncbi:MAG TPA: hypothetical protein VFC84_19440 [Desulfosporosinus sp.]|nr:hypothetical protein [Desulfosporosinus sp.]
MGERWWATLRTLRLTLSSGHATRPLLGGLRIAAWVQYASVLACVDLRKTEAEGRSSDGACQGERWWATLRTLRLTLSSGHATLPLLMGLGGWCWVAICLGYCLDSWRLGTYRRGRWRAGA